MMDELTTAADPRTACEPIGPPTPTGLPDANAGTRRDHGDAVGGGGSGTKTGRPLGPLSGGLEVGGRRRGASGDGNAAPPAPGLLPSISLPYKPPAPGTPAAADLARRAARRAAPPTDRVIPPADRRVVPGCCDGCRSCRDFTRNASGCPGVAMTIFPSPLPACHVDQWTGRYACAAVELWERGWLP